MSHGKATIVRERLEVPPTDRVCDPPRCSCRSAPGCPTLVRRRGMCEAHTAKRYVVTVPPGCGKSTWVQSASKDGDVVWDLDEVASVVSYQGRPIPRAQRGNLCWPTIKAALVMRDALVAWFAQTTLDVSVYILVADGNDAATLQGV